jgi:hypothetical protein
LACLLQKVLLIEELVQMIHLQLLVDFLLLRQMQLRAMLLGLFK